MIQEISFSSQNNSFVVSDGGLGRTDKGSKRDEWISPSFRFYSSNLVELAPNTSVNNFLFVLKVVSELWFSNTFVYSLILFQVKFV